MNDSVFYSALLRTAMTTSVLMCYRRHRVASRMQRGLRGYLQRMR